MHHIYRTRGIIFSGRDVGEADRDLIILSEEFGLIRARAQGVRKIHSKLRHALQIFSIVDLAIVRGRAGFRVTNARLDNNFFYHKRDYPFAKIFLKITTLLERLIQGEDFEPRIFKVVIDAINFYDQRPEKNQKILKQIEIVTVSKILYLLGYFTINTNNEMLIKENFDDKMLALLDVPTFQKEMIKEINSAIKESQL